MAVIGSIRRRSGLLIIIIGLAMLAFILGDIFGNGGLMGGRPETNVGTINGEALTAQELEKRTQYWSNLYSVHYRNPISAEQARQIAWDDIMYRNVLQPEMDKVGLMMPAEEFDDIRFGEGVLDEFKSSQNFKDEAGNFDPSLVSATYEQLANNNMDVWNSEQYRLNRKQLTNKYNRLLSKSIIATDLEAKDSYTAKNSSLDIQYVLKRYSAIPDSTVSVTESDLRSYFNEHKGDAKYQQTAGRDIELISFEVDPSEEDIKFLSEDIKTFTEEFKNATNDSVFSIVNSDSKSYSVFSYTAADLDSTQAEEVFAAQIGDVVGPYEDPSTIKLLKVIGDDEKEEATVRHILIKSDASNDEEMKTRADSVLRAIKRGADFEALVTKYSDDPGSVQNGGKYEWFPKGQMVPEFENFSFDEPIGAKGVVKTNFGYHIIEVLDRRSEPQRKVAEFIKNIEPSSDTFDQKYNEASDFALDIKDIETFRALADEKGYEVKRAAGLRPSARSVSGITNARELVRWAYDTERAVGDITEPIEIDNRFVVAVLTGSREEGEPSFEDIKDDLEISVIKEKKAELIEAEIGTNYSGLEEVVDAWGQPVQRASNLSPTNPSISGVGNELKVVGTAFGFDEGSVLLPIRGNQGVFVVQIDGKKVIDTQSIDLTSEARTIQSTLRNSVNTLVGNSLNKAKGVKNDIDRVY
ncbi:MAG: hypothetical protein HKN45_11035 [Flavobacteriales bacterium]|nr:hypothetical protein [Flavobacteriales bacterium]